jgi:hypothetical protein
MQGSIASRKPIARTNADAAIRVAGAKDPGTSAASELSKILSFARHYPKETASAPAGDRAEAVREGASVRQARHHNSECCPLFPVLNAKLKWPVFNQQVASFGQHPLAAPRPSINSWEPSPSPG